MSDQGPDQGRAFVEAFAAKDPERLFALLAPDVNFRAMTPNRFWEAQQPEEILEILLGNWLEPSDEVLALEEVTTGAVGSRRQVTYRMRVHNPDGEHLVEQRAYYETDGERIRWMRVMCSGFVRI